MRNLKLQILHGEDSLGWWLSTSHRYQNPGNRLTANSREDDRSFLSLPRASHADFSPFMSQVRGLTL